MQARIDVEQGSSLSGALAKHPKVFNNLFIAMVKAGETGGVLDDVLLSLADQIEKEVELRRQIKSAMTYPVVVVALVMLILTAMLLFVVPQFETIYTNLGGHAPAADQDPARRSRTRSGTTGTSSCSGAVVGSFFFRRYKKTDAGRARVDAAKLKRPGVRPAVPQDRPGPVRLDARDAPARPACRSCRRSTS